MGSVTKTTQIYVRVPQSLRDDLEELAKRDDRDLSYVVRQAIREHLDNQNGKVAA